MASERLSSEIHIICKVNTYMERIGLAMLFTYVNVLAGVTVIKLNQSRTAAERGKRNLSFDKTLFKIECQFCQIVTYMDVIVDI